MTERALSEVVKMESRAKFPYLIDIKYNGHNYYFVNADTNVTFNGHTYLASWFNLTPSEKNQNGFSDARITISSVDGVWIQRIRESNEKAKVTFTATIQYLDDGSFVVEPIESMEFVLQNAKWNRTTIEWTLKFDELMDLKVCKKVDGVICPALV